MNDILCEQTLKRTLSVKEKFTNIGILAAGILGIFLSLLFLGSFSTMAIAVILILEYFILLPKRSVEIEYSFFNGELTISYIYNKEKRKAKLELDVRNAEMIAPTCSAEADTYSVQKVLDYSSGTGREETCSVFIRLKGEMVQVLLEPDEKMKKAFEQATRKSIWGS